MEFDNKNRGERNFKAIDFRSSGWGWGEDGGFATGWIGMGLNCCPHVILNTISIQLPQ